MSNYLRDQVLQGCLSSLVNSLPIRQRLANVATYMGGRIAGNWPDDAVLKGKLEAIYARLTSVTPGPDDDGGIDATVKRLSDQEATEIAQAFVRVAFEEMRRSDR